MKNNSFIPRFIALAAISAAFCLASLWASEGPDTVYAGSPDVTSHEGYGGYTDVRLDIVSNSTWVLTANYWCDAYVDQSGEFSTPGGTISYCKYGGYYPSSYSDVIQVPVSISGEDGSLGYIFYSGTSSGPARTEAYSVSQEGFSWETTTVSEYYHY